MGDQNWNRLKQRRDVRVAMAVAFVLWLLVASVPASGRTAAESTVACGQNPEPPIPVALTLSGGVSLGAYQAGFLYYTGLVFQENTETFVTKLITGSSAGGLNTLLSVLSFCGRDPVGPVDSALWKAWIGLRIEDFVGPPDDPRAMLPRKALMRIAADVERIWFEGLPSTCDVVLGVSATRVNPVTLRSASDLDFTRQEEKFALRIRGRGIGRAPEVSNYVNALAGGSQPLLAFEPGDDRQNFAVLRDLLLATSAFPFIFPPQELPYCVAGESSRWLHADYPLTCRAEEIERAEFLDGGLLDNKPLGFAERLARTGLTEERCQGPRWQRIPSVTEAVAQGSSPLFVHVDVASTAYPALEVPSEGRRFMPFSTAFLDRTFNSSRTKDSRIAIEQNPRLSTQVAPARNLFPRAGEHFLGFFGFFERDFRAFDFYLGMYEAREFFRTRVIPNLTRGVDRVGVKVRLPERAGIDEKDWWPLSCLTAIVENGVAAGERSGDCRRIQNPNFVILAQVARDRLRAACALDPVAASRSGSSCHRFATAARHEGESVSRGVQESDLQFTLRLLAERGFEYRDMGLRPDEASLAPAKIKAGALDAIDALAEVQPVADRLAVRAGGPVALNMVDRLPTARDGHVALGSKLSLGLSWLQQSNSYPPRARLGLRAEVDNPGAWIEAHGGEVSSVLLGGAEWELGDISSLLLQLRAGVFAGVRFDPVAGAKMALAPGCSLTLLERLRFGLDLETQPFEEGPPPWRIVPTAGLQFYF